MVQVHVQCMSYCVAILLDSYSKVVVTFFHFVVSLYGIFVGGIADVHTCTCMFK